MGFKAIFFDFMGTCLDWHKSIITALPQSITEKDRSEFALAWRQYFFDRISARHSAHEPPEDIDTTFHQSLLMTLNDSRFATLTGEIEHLAQPNSSLIQAWHSMPAWPDVLPALIGLRDAGYELFVLANGTTRLQLDLVQSSGLRGHLDMLFSSQLLGVYKPSPEAYQKALDVVSCKPEEAVMVACHAYDLRAARNIGMKVVYVRRWTDDILEDMTIVKTEFPDAFLESGFEELLRTIERV